MAAHRRLLPNGQKVYASTIFGCYGWNEFHINPKAQIIYSKVEIMNHEQLKGAFDSVRSNWVFSLAALELFSSDSEEVSNLLSDFNITFGAKKVPFTAIYQPGGNLNFGIGEFAKMGLRVVITEAFELIWDYSKNSQQIEILKSKSWFHFTRLIRNGLSHNHKFVFDPRDKKILPVTWNNKTIDLSLEGKDLKIDIIGYEGVWMLLSEMSTFILNDIH